MILKISWRLVDLIAMYYNINYTRGYRRFLDKTVLIDVATFVCCKTNYIYFPKDIADLHNYENYS